MFSGNDYKSEPFLNDALLSDQQSAPTPGSAFFMTPATDMYHPDDQDEDEGGGIYSSSMPGKKKKGKGRTKSSSFDSMESGGILSLPAEVEASRRKKPKACFCGMLTKVQCGLVVMAVMAVMGAAGVFVGGPAIAKNELDNSEVSFTKLSMSNPSSTDYSFDVAADVKIANVHPLDGTMGEMDVDLYFDDVKLGTLHMPPIDVKAGKETYKSIDVQRFNVVETAYDKWDEFSTAMLNDAVVNWVLKGTASVSSTMLGITMDFKDIPFNKEIPLTCFDGLNDVQMSVFDLTQSTPDEVMVEMSICIENPSDISIEDLGSLYFGVHYDGAYMGNVTSQTSKMQVTKDDPSDPECAAIGEKSYNIVEIRGQLQPADNAKADVLMSRYLAGMDTPVSAIAMSPLADSIPLFNNGMQGLELATTLIGDETALVTGLDFESATIFPIDEDSMSMTMIALVSMTNPLGDDSPMNIRTVDMTVNMGYGDTVIGKGEAGVLHNPRINCRPSS